jgi:hypothetical protein
MVHGAFSIKAGDTAACGFCCKYGISFFRKLVAWAQLTLAVQIYVREIQKRQGMAIQKRQGLAIESWQGKPAWYLKYASEASWRGALIIEIYPTVGEDKPTFDK